MARLLIDMDGVLCDLVGKWFAVYNREHNDAIRLEQMTHWGPHLYARKGKAIYRYLTQPGFFRDLAPIPGAIAGMRKLHAWGHELVIVTAAKNGHRDKMEWVHEHLPFLPPGNIVFAHRKELVRGDVMFDDAPHNLLAFAPYGLPVAMDYPYNQGAPGMRVRSWSEFLQLIRTRYESGFEAPAPAIDDSAARSTAEVLDAARDVKTD
jgi:5'-nucleotidase